MQRDAAAPACSGRGASGRRARARSYVPLSSRRGAARGAKSHPPLRRHRRGRRRVVRRAEGRDRRPHRPERRRQDDRLQPRHAPLLAGRRRHRVRRREPARQPGAQGDRPRHRAHVPEPRALPLDDCARERPRRLARPQAAGGGGRPTRAVPPRVRRPRATSRIARRGRCRTASRSGSRPRARSRPIPSSCCWTSRREGSPARRSSPSATSSAACRATSR